MTRYTTRSPKVSPKPREEGGKGLALPCSCPPMPLACLVPNLAREAPCPHAPCHDLPCHDVPSHAGLTLRSNPCRAIPSRVRPFPCHAGRALPSQALPNHCHAGLPEPTLDEPSRAVPKPPLTMPRWPPRALPTLDEPSHTSPAGLAKPGHDETPQPSPPLAGLDKPSWPCPALPRQALPSPASPCKGPGSPEPLRRLLSFPRSVHHQKG
jgi:hypothetical protein